MPLLTSKDHDALRLLHGRAVEYQDAQRKLFEKNLRWCPACASILPTTSFGRNKAMTLGLASRCTPCAKARRTRSFVKLSDATRRARFHKRNPEVAYSGAKGGSYDKTKAARAAGTYIYDPLNHDLNASQ